MSERPNIHSDSPIVNGCDAPASLRRREAEHNPLMSNEQLAYKVVSDHVLSFSDPEERRSFARQMVAYSIASLAVLEGDRAAAEFAYRAADATVGVA